MAAFTPGVDCGPVYVAARASGKKIRKREPLSTG
jgi:hypothetical protein